MRALIAVVALVLLVGCSGGAQAPAGSSEIAELGEELCSVVRDGGTGGEYLDVTGRAAALVGAEDEAFGVGETLLEVYCPELG